MAKINTARILQAMSEKRPPWGRHDTCVHCRIHSNTLNTLLDGKLPRRLDVLYRLCKGLGISVQEALTHEDFGTTHPEAPSPEELRRDLAQQMHCLTTEYQQRYEPRIINEIQAVCRRLKELK